MDKPRCSIDGCLKPKRSLGLCIAHYNRLRVHGDPLICLLPISPKGEPLRYFREVVMTYEGNECLPWPYARNAGYGILHRKNGTRIVPRRVCEEVYGPAPTPRHEAAHSCGNGHLACCTKRHLSWKTPKANNADKIAHDTLLIGERHQNSKLTDEQVRTPSLVSQIHQRRIWTHIKLEAALYASRDAQERFVSEMECA